MVEPLISDCTKPTSYEMAFAADLKRALEPVCDELFAEVPSQQCQSRGERPEEQIRHSANSNLILGFNCGCSSGEREAWMVQIVPVVAKIVGAQVRLIRDLVFSLHDPPESRTQEFVLGILLRANGGSFVGSFQFAGHPDCGRMLLMLCGEALGRILARVRTPRIDRDLVAPIMGAWGKWSTHEVGRQAMAAISSQSPERNHRSEVIADEAEGEHECDLQRVRILANLLKIEGMAEDRKQEIVLTLIEGGGFSEDEIREFDRRLSGERRFRVDATPFQGRSERKIDLLMDLIGLAAMDRKISLRETEYLKEIVATLQMSAEELADVLEEEARFFATGPRIIPLVG